MDRIAVLIPCYNEEKTIAKVVADAKAALPEAVMYIITIPATQRLNWRRRPGRWCETSICRGKGMLSGGCSGKWKRIAM